MPLIRRAAFFLPPESAKARNGSVVPKRLRRTQKNHRAGVFLHKNAMLTAKAWIQNLANAAESPSTLIVRQALDSQSKSPGH
jgi:hypothetical protein